MKKSGQKTDISTPRRGGIAGLLKMRMPKALSQAQSPSHLTQRQIEEILRREIARRREIVQLRAENAALREENKILKKDIKAKSQAATRTHQQRPEFKAIGVLADSPLWSLREEAIEKMRQAERELYSEDNVEVPS
jgi:uncharacterized membrane protein YgaE (UPF0421/DUF939 family)